MHTDLDLIASLGNNIPRHLNLSDPDDAPVKLPEVLRPFYLGSDNGVMTFIFDTDQRETRIPADSHYPERWVPDGLTSRGREQLAAVDRALATIGYGLDPEHEFEDGLFFYTAAPIDN
jgi:hypothetical protein